jgi:hypothetical protein
MNLDQTTASGKKQKEEDQFHKRAPETAPAPTRNGSLHQRPNSNYHADPTPGFPLTRLLAKQPH